MAARMVWDHEVGGSNPPTPTTFFAPALPKPRIAAPLACPRLPRVPCVMLQNCYRFSCLCFTAAASISAPLV